MYQGKSEKVHISAWVSEIKTNEKKSLEGKMESFASLDSAIFMCKKFII